MPKKVRILLVGGGSGGHIIPNLVVASAIKKKAPETTLLYISSFSRLDAQLLKGSGMRVKSIFSGKWRRYFSWKNFIDPFFIGMAFFQSLFILIKFRPQVVFSKGGYVSLPVAMAAFGLRIPLVLHESDSRMGLANRLVARVARRVCVAFPALEKKGKKYRFTGNPVRSEILSGDPKKSYQLTGFNSKKPVLLVWGGSQGAAQVNKLLLSDLEKFTAHFQVIHITGKDKSPNSQLPTPNAYKAFEYVGKELKDLYAITSLVIGRAGANSLAEIALLQKPNILIPLGNTDQLNNALYFKQAGAAVVYQEGQNLFDITFDLWQNEGLKSKMKSALAQLATPEAADQITTLILTTKKQAS